MEVMLLSLTVAYLGEISPSEVTGTEVHNRIQFNPRLMAPDSRLAVFAGLYERFEYVPSKTVIHFAHASSTSAKGSMIHGTEPDPKDRFPAGNLDRIRYITSHKQNATFSPWTNSSVRLPDLTPKQMEYYIDAGEGDSSDVRLTVQADYRCIVKSTLDVSATAGGLWVHYRVKLFQAKFDISTEKRFLGGQFANVAPPDVDIPISGPLSSDNFNFGASNWDLPYDHGFNNDVLNKHKRVYFCPTTHDVTDLRCEVLFEGTGFGDTAGWNATLGSNVTIKAMWMGNESLGTIQMAPGSYGATDIAGWTADLELKDPADVEHTYIEFTKAGAPTTLVETDFCFTAYPDAPTRGLQKKINAHRKKMIELKRDFEAIEELQKKLDDGKHVYKELERDVCLAERKDAERKHVNTPAKLVIEDDMKMEVLSEASEPKTPEPDVTKSQVLGVISSLFAQSKKEPIGQKRV